MNACAASLLVLRWKRAKDTLALTEQSLNQAMSAYAAGEHNIRICYNCILIVNKFVLMLQCLKRMLSSGLKRRKSAYCPHLLLHQVLAMH